MPPPAERATTAGVVPRRGAGRRRGRGGDETRRQLQQAAFALFARHGYDGVPVGVIADAADVTKAALYWHFPGKDAIYADCLAELQAIYRRHVFGPAEAEANAGLRPVALFEGIARLLADPRIRDGVAGYWLKPLSTDLPLAGETQRLFEEDAGGRVAVILEEAAAAGTLRRVGDVPLLARAVVSIVVAAVLPLQSHTPPQTAQLLTALARIFFQAWAAADLADELTAAAGRRIAAVLDPSADQSQIAYDVASMTTPA